MNLAEDFARLIVEKRSLFLGLIRRYEKDPEVAEDILSLATVHMLSSGLENFKNNSSLSSYFGTIVINAAKQHVGSQLRRKEAGVYYDHEGSDPETDLENNEGAVATEGNPQSAAESKEDLARADRLMAVLEKKVPLPLVAWKMHILEDMSYDEISEHLGISTKVARNHVYRVYKTITTLNADGAALY